MSMSLPRRRRLPVSLVVVTASVLVISHADTASSSVGADYSGASIAVTANWSGTNQNTVATGTSVSLTSFTVGSGPNEALYVALTSQATTLTSPSCVRNTTEVLNLQATYTWNASNNDSIYIFYLGHGSGFVQAGTQTISCSWSNSATVAIGAASFYNVDTYRAQYLPSIVTAGTISSSPQIGIPSATSNATLAVMMRGTASSVLFDSRGPVSPPAQEVWAYNTTDSNNSVATQAAGATSVTHQWDLTGSAPWAAVGIDIPAAQSNFIDVFVGGVPRGVSGARSVDLSTFIVGSGSSEAMFVAVTSPGALADLAVTWDAGGVSPQSMSQVDVYSIPGGSVPYCAAFGGDTCITSGSPTQAHLYWYSLIAPHSGNHVLNVSWTNDLSGSAEPLVDVGAISFSGVDQSVPALQLTHSAGYDSAVNSHDSITINTAVGDETVALWGSIHGDACDWNQTANWPHSGHGIASDSSRAAGTGTSNTHSLVHYSTSCYSETPSVGYWGMSGFDIAASTSSAVAPDFSGTTFKLVDPGTSVTLSTLTVGTGSNEALYAGLSTQNSTLTSPSCSWDSQAMTNIGTLTLSDKSSVYVYRLLSPHSGNGSLTCRWSNSVTVVLGAFAVSGVNQTTPERHLGTANGNSTSPSISIASASGNMTFAVGVNGGADWMSSSQTVVWQDTSGIAWNGAASRAAGASSNTHSFTTEEGDSLLWGLIGFDIVAAP
jgi:hypothetical protein